MKVSIIIPTYNQSNYILKTVHSALAQTYQDIEVIVSDDSTNDETEKLLKQYESQLKYIRNKPARGRVANYHFLLHECATGDFVLNIDGDDFLNDNTFVERCVNLLKQNSNVVFIMAGAQIIDEDDNVIGKKMSGNQVIKIPGKEYFLNYYPTVDSFFHSATIYNRKKAIQVNFYSFDSLNTDANSILKLALHGNVILLNKTPLSWRTHPDNASKNVNLNENSAELLAMLDVANYAKSYLPIKKIDKWTKQVTLNIKKSNIYQLIRAKKKGMAIQALKNYPLNWFSIKQWIKLFVG